jgi:2-hydroxycyclohexanecarboxyl-CoA dehydrogenase
MRTAAPANGTAIVTGAGSGIGRAITHRLLEDGWKVAATDIDAAGLEQTVAGRPADRVIAITVDVTDLEGLREAVAEVERTLGRVSGLVNSAGWERRAPFVESAPEDWDRIVAVNLRGVFNASRAVLDGMIAGEDGRIVSISSDAGRVGSSHEAVYAGAKAGIIGFSKGLAREMARHKVNVNVVCPGPTDTPMLREAGESNPKLNEALRRAIPLRRVAAPEEVAAAAAFLLSDDARYITGQTLSVSGGLTMV